MLIDDGGLYVAPTDQLTQESFWFLMRNQKARPDALQVLAQVIDGLQVEPGPQVATLFDFVLVHRPVVKARIEAVNREHFLVCDLLVFRGPVHHWVIVDAQVIAEPENYAVHAFLVERVIESF